MLDAKTVADLITMTRGLLGLVMVLLGWTQGGRALPIVVLLMIICWTGDFVDGGIARRSRRPRRTYIGDHDVYVDLFVSLCLGVYLIGAGFVGFAFCVFYLLVWALIFWRFGLEHNLLMLMQAPIYLDLILLAVRYVPESGVWLIAWVLVATAINWHRFSHEIVPRFVAGMKNLRGSRRL